MTTHASQVLGSHKPSTTKLLCLQHVVLLHSTTDRPCSSNLLPPQVEQTSDSEIRKDLPSPERDASVGRRKRRMSLLRNNGSKKSATILHAVPETTCDTGLLTDQRDTTTYACQDVRSKSQPLSGSQPSTSPTYKDISRSRTRGSSATQSPIKSGAVDDLKSVFSNSSLKGAIGVYKHGKIQWRQKDRACSETGIKNGLVAEKRLRPKIHVIIPSENRDRPLPALPFFGQPTRNHITTAAISCENVQDVSPPSSGPKGVMRNSVVSPLNQLQPADSGNFQRSMSRAIRKPSAARHRRGVSRPSTSSVDSHDSDSASTYSNRSSETSVEADSPAFARKHTRHYSVQNPVVAGVFDSSPESYVKPFVQPSSAPPRRYTHHTPIEADCTFRRTCTLQRTRNASGGLSRQPTINRKSSKCSTRRRSLASTMGVIDGAISRSTSRQLSSTLRVSSPTLSEAENDLEEQLTSFEEDLKPRTPTEADKQRLTTLTETSPFHWDEVVDQETSSLTVHQPQGDSSDVGKTTSSPPALPRKSSKRQSVNPDGYRMSRVPRDHIASQLERSRSRQRLTITIPEFNRVTENFEPLPLPVPPKHVKRTITPKSAEGVILNIFLNLTHFDDLFAAAVVNRGFYRVFKRHELDLIKSTLKKMSPPAWEFREIAFPGHDMLHDEDLEMTRPQEEYTPSTYLQLQKRDTHTIRSIKTLIREKCQSFVRPEISIALMSDSAPEAARIDNALWRIWTFCKIFGSGKGREEDIVAQQDWLRGGAMVHQQACTSSFMSTDFMNDTLVGAPECFAKGNEGGLTAEQLFDMMELWNCLGVLLQGFEGRTAQAREHGIYDNTEIRGGDIDGEEMMLDEWCYYLLTFGLSTVLELATPLHTSPFKLAANHGWTTWTPPVFGGSRRNFFKEAASRVYEDKIAYTYATTSTRDIQRQLSKQRIQRHITELRHRKTNGPRLPMIRMSQERPMSEWSTVMNNLTRAPPLPENNIVSHIPTIRSSSAHGQDLTVPIIAELPASRTPPPPDTSTRSSSPHRTFAQPLLPTPPPSTVPSTRDRSSVATSMPSIEEHPQGRVHQHQHQHQHPVGGYYLPDDKKSMQMQHSIPPPPPLSTHPAFRHYNPSSFLHPQSHPHQPSHPPHQQYNPHTTHVRQGSADSANSAFAQHPTQDAIFGSQAHENTAEKAIYRIVEMGFTAEQAREALRMTDLGDGLRVEAAVNVLLARV
ncbi:hypothetical protein BKA63DRAFT_413527 [Paraphoma chrysanthemicola]|nr:hypothetical protein BKA63DRAFT_413527 [Paraphoma chrysanthemicola]